MPTRSSLALSKRNSIAFALTVYGCAIAFDRFSNVSIDRRLGERVRANTTNNREIGSCRPQNIRRGGLIFYLFPREVSSLRFVWFCERVPQERFPRSFSTVVFRKRLQSKISETTSISKRDSQERFPREFPEIFSLESFPRE